MTPLPEIHVNPKTIPILESLGVRVERMIALQMTAYPDHLSPADRREMAELYFSKGGPSHV